MDGTGAPSVRGVVREAPHAGGPDSYDVRCEEDALTY